LCLRVPTGGYTGVVPYGVTALRIGFADLRLAGAVHASRVFPCITPIVFGAGFGSRTIFSTGEAVFHPIAFSVSADRVGAIGGNGDVIQVNALGSGSARTK